MATTKAPSTNPLADSLTKVTGIDPLSTTAGTSPISYDPDMAFRAPESDIIQISGDPGTGATQAETWSHELSLEQLQQDQLEFEYAQQQDLIDQAYNQQQYQLAAQQAASQESQWTSEFGIQQAEEQRAAALAPYQVESASLANQTAAYALPAQQLAAEQAQRQMDQNKAMYDIGMAKWAKDIKTPGFTYTPAGSGQWYTVNSGGVPVPVKEKAIQVLGDVRAMSIPRLQQVAGSLRGQLNPE